MANSKISGILEKYGNDTQLSMMEDHDLGDAVTALAGLSGAPKVQAAIQAASILAALAGPRGGLVGLGEVQPIGSSVVSVGGDSPAQLQLTELLVSPLRFLQDDLLAYSQRVDPVLLKRFSTSLADPHRRDPGQRHPVSPEAQSEAELKHVIGLAWKSTQTVSKGHPVDRHAAFLREQGVTDELRDAAEMLAAMYPSGRGDYESMVTLNEARCLREPLVLLESPDSQVLLRGMDQIDHQSPLVLDADGRLLAGIFGKPRHKDAEVIEGLLSGRSTRAWGRGGASPGRGVMFSIIDRHRLARWIGNSEAGSYLSRTLLVDPGHATEEGNGPCDVESIQRGYVQYRAAVKDILRLRRLDAPGVAPILGDEAAERFFNAQRKFRSQIDEVEPRLKPYAAPFVYLPATMLWALEKLCASREFRDLVPTAIHLAEAAMTTHLRIVKSGLEAGERQSLEDEGRKMLRKISQIEPCRIRQLQRTYDIKRKSHLLPVLEHLIETRWVRQAEKGVLRVTELGRIELKTVGAN